MSFEKKRQVLIAELCCVEVWLFFFFSAGMKMSSHSERQWKMKLIPYIK